jgi:hypothetical protein
MRRLIWIAALLAACDAQPSAPSDVGAALDAGFVDAAPDVGFVTDTGTSTITDAGLRDAEPSDDGVWPDADLPDSGPSGPTVDRTNPQLFHVSFSADEADPAATMALGTELAALDTRVAPRGELVVYLHGAGAPTNCGATAHADFLADLGFHVVMPCYVSNYGVGNCGNDIGGCRLEAFEGVDHTSVIDDPGGEDARAARGRESRR